MKIKINILKNCLIIKPLHTLLLFRLFSKIFSSPHSFIKNKLASFYLKYVLSGLINILKKTSSTLTLLRLCKKFCKKLYYNKNKISKTQLLCFALLEIYLCKANISTSFAGKNKNSNYNQGSKTLLQQHAQEDPILQKIEEKGNAFCLIRYPRIASGESDDAISYWTCRKNYMQREIVRLNLYDYYKKKQLDSYIQEFEYISSYIFQNHHKSN